MLQRKPGYNYIEQKIFLPNLDSWFSNFIIEEFRTDYLPESKIQTKINFQGQNDYLLEAKTYKRIL